GARRPRRRLRIRRAAGTRAGAVLGLVTLSRRGAADRARRLEGDRRTDGSGAGAGLVHVAEAGGGAADRAGVPRRVLAVLAAPVALVEAARIAVVGARRPRRSLGVRRAAGARAGAILARITLSRRGAADRGRRLESVRRARRARAGAGLVDVAEAGGRPADCPGAPRRVLACHARPFALVGAARIAVGGARRPARRFGVGRAVGSVAGAVLRRIAFARRDTALRARGCKPIGRAGRARAGARLRDVAHTGRPTAHRSGVACGVLAGRARPVALVRGAGIAVGSA